jgi:hypothetical protein
MLIVGLENAIAFVQHLQHTDERLVVADQGDGQQATGVVAGLAIDVAVEAVVGVAVGHIDHLPVLRGLPGDAGARGEANFLFARGHLRVQLVVLRIVEEHGGTFGFEHLQGRRHHLFEQLLQLRGPAHLARHVQHPPQGTCFEFRTARHLTSTQLMVELP